MKDSMQERSALTSSMPSDLILVPAFLSGKHSASWRGFYGCSSKLTKVLPHIDKYYFTYYAIKSVNKYSKEKH